MRMLILALLLLTSPPTVTWQGDDTVRVAWHTPANVETVCLWRNIQSSDGAYRAGLGEGCYGTSQGAAVVGGIAAGDRIVVLSYGGGVELGRSVVEVPPREFQLYFPWVPYDD